MHRTGASSSASSTSSTAALWVTARGSVQRDKAGKPVQLPGVRRLAGLGDRVVRYLHPLPAIIAVHRPVAPHDRPDAGAAGLFAPVLDALEDFLGSQRRFNHLVVRKAEGAPGFTARRIEPNRFRCR